MRAFFPFAAVPFVPAFFVSFFIAVPPAPIPITTAPRRKPSQLLDQRGGRVLPLEQLAQLPVPGVELVDADLLPLPERLPGVAGQRHHLVAAVPPQLLGVEVERVVPPRVHPGSGPHPHEPPERVVHLVGIRSLPGVVYPTAAVLYTQQFKKKSAVSSAFGVCVCRYWLMTNMRAFGPISSQNRTTLPAAVLRPAQSAR